MQLGQGLHTLLFDLLLEFLNLVLIIGELFNFVGDHMCDFFSHAHNIDKSIFATGERRPDVISGQRTDVYESADADS